MRNRKSALVLSTVLLLVIAAPSALAHDEDIILSFSDYTEQTGTHEDADPFKGLLNVTVTNNMSEAWGDFHIEITDVGWDVSNVDIIVASPNQPTSSQTGLTWAVDNEVVGSTIDLYYYSDPVDPGDTATFTIYTDNTTDRNWFGWCMYPTPVPEPASLTLLVVGGLALLRRRR